MHFYLIVFISILCRFVSPISQNMILTPFAFAFGPVFGSGLCHLIFPRKGSRKPRFDHYKGELPSFLDQPVYLFCCLLYFAFLPGSLVVCLLSSIWHSCFLPSPYLLRLRCLYCNTYLHFPFHTCRHHDFVLFKFSDNGSMLSFWFKGTVGLDIFIPRDWHLSTILWDGPQHAVLVCQFPSFNSPFISTSIVQVPGQCTP